MSDRFPAQMVNGTWTYCSAIAKDTLLRQQGRYSHAEKIRTISPPATSMANGNIDLAIANVETPYLTVLNADGLRDIVVTCAQNNKLMLYLGSPNGGFTIATQSVQTGWAGIALAGLEGRGKDDIVVSNGLLDEQPRTINGTITILSSK